MNKSKLCKRCDKIKPISLFGKNKSSKDGLCRLCKHCTNEAKRIWSKDNRPSINATNLAWKRKNIEKVRLTNLNQKYKSRYGITLDEFKELSKKQKGKCAICNRRRKLCLDHDHETNKNRELLCGKCNRGIGCFEDSSIVLYQAMRYLQHYGK